MSTMCTGRDGRPLVTTAMTAYSLGMKPASFPRVGFSTAPTVRAWAA
ncbi:hypothetical protein ACH47Z_30195 [Streptomyces sp. NPDC020192]